MLGLCLLCLGVAHAGDASRPLSVGTAAEAKAEFRPDAVPLGQVTQSTGANGKPTTAYFVAIYGGSSLGQYYYVANAICDAVNRRHAEHRVNCVALRSQGAGSNVQLLAQGRSQMAIVQSDMAYQAASGESPVPGMRSVASLHPELGVLVVGPRSEISAPKDLRGHRLTIPPPGTAANLMWGEYLPAMGLQRSDMAEVAAYKQDYSYYALCNRMVDVFGIWVGHPLAVIDTTIRKCGAKVVGMWDPKLEVLMKSKPYYFRGRIPAGTYGGQEQALDSWGVKAALVAHEKTKDHIVYWVTRVIVEDVALLRKTSPVLSALDVTEMHAQGNFLPFHPGALRYWQEVGK